MVSVLLATYNGHRFIKESIDSVLNQTYKDLELLIGLNGENSETRKILESYKDPRIRIFDYGEEKGKAKTLNKLLKECMGSFVCLQDDDDIWMPNKLEKQLEFTESYDIVGSLIKYIDESGEMIGSPNLSIYNGDILARSFSGDNQIANTSAIFRIKDSMEVCGWEEDKDGFEDFNFWLKLMKRGKKFCNIPEYLVHHRIHASSNFNTKRYNLNEAFDVEQYLSIKDIAVHYWIKDESKYLELLPLSFYSSKSINEHILNDGKFYFFDVKDSIHYKTLLDRDFSLYNFHIKETQQREHSENNFRDLIENFDLKKLTKGKNKIRIYHHKETGRYILKDGLHRLCLYFFKSGWSSIPFKYISLT